MQQSAPLPRTLLLPPRRRRRRRHPAPTTPLPPPPPCRRSPLWDQEDLYGREGCRTVNVVSMPFVWEPPPNALGDGRPLPMPQSRSLHPTFGALTAGTDEPLRTE